MFFWYRPITSIVFFVIFISIQQKMINTIYIYIDNTSHWWNLGVFMDWFPKIMGPCYGKKGSFNDMVVSSCAS